MEPEYLVIKMHEYPTFAERLTVLYGDTIPDLLPKPTLIGEEIIKTVYSDTKIDTFSRIIDQGRAKTDFDMKLQEIESTTRSSTIEIKGKSESQVDYNKPEIYRIPLINASHAKDSDIKLTEEEKNHMRSTIYTQVEPSFKVCNTLSSVKHFSPRKNGESKMTKSTNQAAATSSIQTEKERPNERKEQDLLENRLYQLALAASAKRELPSPAKTTSFDIRQSSIQEMHSPKPMNTSKYESSAKYKESRIFVQENPLYQLATIAASKSPIKTRSPSKGSSTSPRGRSQILTSNIKGQQHSTVSPKTHSPSDIHKTRQLPNKRSPSKIEEGRQSQHLLRKNLFEERAAEAISKTRIQSPSRTRNTSQSVSSPPTQRKTQEKSSNSQSKIPQSKILPQKLIHIRGKSSSYSLISSAESQTEQQSALAKKSPEKRSPNRKKSSTTQLKLIQPVQKSKIHREESPISTKSSTTTLNLAKKPQQTLKTKKVQISSKDSNKTLSTTFTPKTQRKLQQQSQTEKKSKILSEEEDKQDSVIQDNTTSNTLNVTQSTTEQQSKIISEEAKSPIKDPLLEQQLSLFIGTNRVQNEKYLQLKRAIIVHSDPSHNKQIESSSSSSTHHPLQASKPVRTAATQIASNISESQTQSLETLYQEYKAQRDLHCDASYKSQIDEINKLFKDKLIDKKSRKKYADYYVDLLDPNYSPNGVIDVDVDKLSFTNTIYKEYEDKPNETPNKKRYEEEIKKILKNFLLNKLTLNSKSADYAKELSILIRNILYKYHSDYRIVVQVLITENFIDDKQTILNNITFAKQWVFNSNTDFESQEIYRNEYLFCLVQYWFFR